MYRPQRASAVLRPEDRPFPQAPQWFGFLVALAAYAAAYLAVDTLPQPWRQKLSEPLVDGKYVSIDLWSGIHFIIFVFLGFVRPDSPITLFVFGGLWELGMYVGLLRFPHLGSIWKVKDVKIVW